MDSRAKNVVAVAVVAAGLAATRPAAADDAVLSIPGVPGESTVQGHSSEIDLLSWSWGAVAASSSTIIRSLTITKRFDKASPQFAQFASGSVKGGIGIKGPITLTVRRNTNGDAGVKGAAGSIANGTDFVKLQIADARVVSVKISQGSDSRPVEEVTFSFTTVSYGVGGQAGSTTIKGESVTYDMSSLKSI